jgi:anti-sigma regulatory factor (Ser/Thr protein kinase)
VLEIVREACSNAIRHGSADEIKLEFSRHSMDLIGLRVTNNGGRGLESSRRGLGSVYLDDCTYSHELKITEFGAVLNALVPIRFEQ